jgi:hypothetical protein
MNSSYFSSDLNSVLFDRTISVFKWLISSSTSLISTLANKSHHSATIQPPKMPIPSLPLEIWQKILELVDIHEAIAFFKAHFIGAFIESTQGIRFRDAINSYMRSNVVELPVGPLASFVCLQCYARIHFEILWPSLLARSKISPYPIFKYRCESQVV